MKTQFNLFLFVAFIVASCNTSKDVIYDANSNFKNSLEMEVVSSMPTINHNESVATVPTVDEVKPISTSLVLIETSTPSEVQIADQPSLPVATTVQKEITILTTEQLKTKMADELRLVASTVDSRFAGRIISRTANKIEAKDFTVKTKLSFFDKTKLKLFGKMQQRYAINNSMDVADILAIVSLVTGILSLGAFYGSFLLGLAAIITGAIALKKGTARRGMAIAGIIMGVVGILFWSGWIFIAMP